MINSSFMRLQNPDATADVICLNCFKAIARSQQMRDLAVAENNHICDPCDLILLRYGSSDDIQNNSINARAKGSARGPTAD